MTTPVSSGLPQHRNISSGGDTKDILVTLSSVKALPDEEVSALLAALGFKTGDVEAFNQKYKMDVRQFLKEGLTKPSRQTIDASPQAGFQANIRISRHNYDLFTKFITGQRATDGAVKPTLPKAVNIVDAYNSKHGINVGEQNKAKLFRLADQAEVDRTSFGTPSNLDDLKHFSVSVASATKAADTNNILDAFITKNFGDTLPFAKSRADVLEIAKGSGVELKNAKVTNGKAEFDLTLESQLKIKIAYNAVRDGINRADAARNETINNNAVSQFTLGVFEGAANSVEGTAQMITDPAGTVKAVWQIVGNPVETFNAIYKELGETSQEFRNAQPEQKARMVGKLVGTLVTEILIGKGIGKVGGIIAETKTGAALVEKAKAVKLATAAKVAEAFSDEAAALAAKRIKQSLARPNAYVGAAGAELMRDFAIMAGNKIGKGTISFKEFSTRMVYEFGDSVKPHLEKIYTEAMEKFGKIVDRNEIRSLNLDDIKPHPDAIIDPPKAVRNSKLAGQNHPVTDIPYNRKSYPVFNSKEDVILPDNLRGHAVSDTAQFKYATKQLKGAIEKDPQMADIFTPRQLEDIRQENPYIDGLTWHHHEDGIRLQLVDRNIHAKSGHDGGRKNTGGRP